MSKEQCYNNRRTLRKKKYYKDDPDAVKKRDSTRVFINGKEISKKDPLYKMYKPGRYKTLNDAAFVMSPLGSVKKGYVYVITNPSWPDWVKIGMAIDAQDRLSGYQTSSPHRDYVLEHSVWSNQRRKAEQQAHYKAALVAEEVAGEWFKLPVDKAIEVLDNLDVYGTRTPQEANTHTSEDKLQERSSQGNLWDYAEDIEAKRAN